MITDRALRETFRMNNKAVALYGDPIRWITVSAAAMILSALAVTYVSVVNNTAKIRHFQDFGTFVESAKRVLAGGSSYQVSRVDDPNLIMHGGNLNPPHFSLLVIPLTLLPISVAFYAWLSLSGCCLVLSLWLVSRSLRLRVSSVIALSAAAFAAAPMVATLMTGQVALLLLLPYTLAWKADREGRPLRAAVWIGLCASFKPFFILFAVYFVLLRRYRAALAAITVTLAVFTVGVAIFGWAEHFAWMRELALVDWEEHYFNASILGWVNRMVVASERQPWPLVNAPWLVLPLWISVSGAVGLALVRVRGIPSTDRQHLFVMTSALLLSPLAWLYYLWFLLAPLAGTLVSGEVRRPRWRVCLLGAAIVGIFVPPSLPWASAAWGHGLWTLTVGSIYFWSLVALWVALLGERNCKGESAVATGLKQTIFAFRQ